MPEVLQLQKILNRNEQVAHYHSQSRIKSFRDPATGLSGTHNLGIIEANIATSAVFPNRLRPITFTTAILITGPSPQGIIFEFGSSTTGLKLGINESSLQVAAGDGIDDSSNGCDGSWSAALFTSSGIGTQLNIAVSINPGLNRVNVWVSGIIRIITGNTAAMDMGWADADSGSIASVPSGTVTQRGSNYSGAPVDFKIVQAVKVFGGQLPKQFNTAIITTPIVEFLPTDLPGLSIWLDAADTDTITADLNAVRIWGDKSVAGKNVTQFTGALKPTTNISTLNSLNIIDFDGNNFLSNTSFSDFSTLTMFVVGEYIGGINPSKGMVEISSGSFDTGANFIHNSDESRFFINSSGGKVAVKFDPLPAQHIFTGIVDGIDIKYYVDGALEQTTLAGTLLNTLTQIDVGRLALSAVSTAAALTGSIAEITIYNRALLDSERDDVHNYLSNKWGITLNPVFSPIDLPSLRVWLDASDALTITKDGGDNVSSWDDKSIIENDAEQLTGASQPLWVDSVVNGLPVVRFDGAATFMTFDDNILSGTTGRTFFMVVRAVATDQDEAIVSLTTDNSAGSRYDIIPTVVIRVASGNKIFNENVVDATDFFILTIQNAASSDVNATEGWINGVAMTQLSSGPEPINTGTDGVSAIGRSQLALTFRWFEGDLAELVCCDEALSSTDRKLVESFLADKYALALPPSFPIAFSSEFSSEFS